MVSKGLSDLIVRIGEKRVNSMKCVLMNGNETFKKLLEDVQFDGELVLCEGSSINGFLEIEKYYSGGYMNLLDENVIDILSMSIYYNDKEILNLCIEYIKNHLDDEMILRILELYDLLNKEEIGELIKMSEKYLKDNGYRYLNNERLLHKLRVENLKMILENENLIIKDDNWLLNVLMKWYKNKSKKIEKEEEKKELNEELKRIMIKSIHFEKLRMNEVECEILDELKRIEMNDYLNEIKNKKKYEYYKFKGIKDEIMERIVMKYYNSEEELIEEEDLRLLNNMKEEELDNMIISLLAMKNLKMTKLVLMILVFKKMRIENYIGFIEKRNILSELCSDYNEKKSKRTLICLSLFIDNRKLISIIKDFCRKEILYRILNELYYLKYESREKLVEYINEIKMSLEEEEEMKRIIINEEILEEIETKEITSFSYPESKYSFPIYEKISIIPSADGCGNRVKYSINPSLPSGIIIDIESGTIYGKAEEIYEEKEYEITCKNTKNEKKYKISLEFINIKFSESNRSDDISISDNGKVITDNNDNADSWDYCYLNIKMESGIYHIKYQFHQNQSENDEVCFGLATEDNNNNNNNHNISHYKLICEYNAWSGKSQDITKHCHIGRVVNNNPNFNNHGDGSIYEIIVDMNKREFWISHNNSSPVLLVKDLPSSLYPYVELQNRNTSVELLSVSYQN